MFSFLVVVLKSLENLSNCQHFNFSHTCSVAFSAMCTHSHQRSLQSSNHPSDRNLGIHLLSSPVGVGWIAYAMLRLVIGEDWQHTLGEAELNVVRLKRVVPARGVRLRLLLVPHSIIRTPSCQQRAQVQVSVLFTTRAFSPPPHSELSLSNCRLPSRNRATDSAIILSRCRRKYSYILSSSSRRQASRPLLCSS